MSHDKIVFIVGPTAVGKSKIALCVARKLKGEIISCDAMQIYKEITIASNQPSQKQRRTIAHHLIGTISVRQNYNVAKFAKEAQRKIKMIHKKKKIPIIVGGSGLYMNILLDGIFQEVVNDRTLRKKLQDEAIKKGSKALHTRLQKKDSQAALKIHPHDTKRIIRALEVVLTTKKPISQLQKNRKGLWGTYEIDLFALNRKRNVLYAMINKRVDAMIRNGLIQEIKKVSARPMSKTARGMIGIKEIKGFLKGQMTLSQAGDMMKQNSRRLAKRQLIWFRKEKRLSWIMIQDNDTSTRIAKRIINAVKYNG